MEGLWGVFRNPPANPYHFKQLVLAAFILFFRSQFLKRFSMAVRKSNNGVSHHLHGLEFLLFCQCFLIAYKIKR